MQCKGPGHLAQMRHAQIGGAAIQPSEAFAYAARKVALCPRFQVLGIAPQPLSES
jgi:hypothetical protein